MVSVDVKHHVYLLAVPLWEGVAVKTPRTFRGVLPGPQRDFFAGLSFFNFAMLSPNTVTEAPMEV